MNETLVALAIVAAVVVAAAVGRKAGRKAGRKRAVTGGGTAMGERGITRVPVPFSGQAGGTILPFVQAVNRLGLQGKLITGVVRNLDMYVLWETAGPEAEEIQSALRYASEQVKRIHAFDCWLRSVDHNTENSHCSCGAERDFNNFVKFLSDHGILITDPGRHNDIS